MQPHLDTIRRAATDLVLRHLLDTRGLPLPDDTEQMLFALQAATVARDALDQSLIDWAGAARRSGASWQQIGDTLGSSRQAAQKRFGDRIDETPIPTTPSQVLSPALGQTTDPSRYPYHIQVHPA